MTQINKCKIKKVKKKFKKAQSLSEAVAIALEEYFDHLEEETTTDLYDLFLREVEAPMLKVVMERTRSNQSAAAQVLGLNRGTLRKKLKEHKLI
jgi:Fis family transcriptional regulator, factor for inversion stimulation protein